LSEEDLYETFLKVVWEEKRKAIKTGKFQKKLFFSKTSEIIGVDHNHYCEPLEETMEMFSNISEDNLALLYFVK